MSINITAQFGPWNSATCECVRCTQYNARDAAPHTCSVVGERV
jgi:hypothetical protein